MKIPQEQIDDAKRILKMFGISEKTDDMSPNNQSEGEKKDFDTKNACINHGRTSHPLSECEKCESCVIAREVFDRLKEEEKCQPTHRSDDEEVCIDCFVENNCISPSSSEKCCTKCVYTAGYCTNCKCHEDECICIESSCSYDCNKKHTHKIFSCEKCNNIKYGDGPSPSSTETAELKQCKKCLTMKHFTGEYCARCKSSSIGKSVEDIISIFNNPIYKGSYAAPREAIRDIIIKEIEKAREDAIQQERDRLKKIVEEMMEKYPTSNNGREPYDVHGYKHGLRDLLLALE